MRTPFRLLRTIFDPVVWPYVFMGLVLTGLAVAGFWLGWFLWGPR